jgi:peptidoglycan/LPS O-acetylase OafA/YrhL
VTRSPGGRLAGQIGRPARELKVGRYIPALDGLRGICMLAVLIGHLVIFSGYGLLFNARLGRDLGGGELGLEVFFVLSGALITHLALSEIEKSGTINMRAFRTRRVRRLAPALVIIVTTTIWLAASGIHGNLLPLGKEPVLVIVSVVALGSNWLLFSGANLGYLTPTWSLAVEEQFYLLWPMVLRRAWRRLGPGGTAMAALALLIAGVGVAATLVSRDIYATYATPVAGVGLLSGCLIAIGLHSPWAPRLSSILGSTPLAVLMALAMGFTARWLHFHVTTALEGGYFLFDVETALFVGHCFVRSTTRSPISSVLGCAPLAFLGRISYGAYLYHATIYQMWDRSGLLTNSWVRGFVDVGSTLVAATVSFYLIEEPIRRGRVRFPRLRRQLPTPVPVPLSVQVMNPVPFEPVAVLPRLAVAERRQLAIADIRGQTAS